VQTQPLCPVILRQLLPPPHAVKRAGPTRPAELEKARSTLSATPLPLGRGSIPSRTALWGMPWSRHGCTSRMARI